MDAVISRYIIAPPKVNPNPPEVNYSPRYKGRPTRHKY